MPRYEFSEGTSNKFWEIELSGSSFTTTYGKIGAAGQTTLKEFKSAADAKKEYDKLVAEKTKKGYQLVGGGKPARSAAAPAPAKAAAAKTAKAKAAKPKRDAEVDEDDDAPAGGGQAGERYFEFVEGSSSKFWAISIDGTTVKTRYGKIGTPGQATMKDGSSKAEAFKEFDKLIAEKTRKGYVEKTSGGAAVRVNEFETDFVKFTERPPLLLAG